MKNILPCVIIGNSMDAKSHRAHGTQRLYRVEGEM